MPLDGVVWTEEVGMGEREGGEGELGFIGCLCHDLDWRTSWYKVSDLWQTW